MAEQAELDALRTATAALSVPDQARLNELTRKLATATAHAATVTQTWFVFLDDLLSDNEGITLHRFQFVVWTIALGIIFIHSVFHKLSMPEFRVLQSL